MGAAHRTHALLSPPATARLAAGVALTLVYVVPQYAQSPSQAVTPCSISGLVQSGAQPLPGVTVVALGPDGAEHATTSTEANGAYVMRLSQPGTYVVKAALAAFAQGSRDATLASGDCTIRVDLSLTLSSRAGAARSASASVPSTAAAAAPAANAGRGAAPAPSTGRGSPGAGRGGRGFQQLSVVANATGEQAAATSADEGTATLRAELQLPPGFSADAPTETVATAGIQGQSNDALLFGGRGGRGEFGEGGPEGFGRGGPGGEGGFGGGDQAGPGGGGFGGGGRGGGPGGGGPGSAGCAAAPGSRATPTTTSAARSSTPRRTP
jgi:hypothetical protein